MRTSGKLRLRDRADCNVSRDRRPDTAESSPGVLAELESFPGVDWFILWTLAPVSTVGLLLVSDPASATSSWVAFS